jgi:uncharacterized protein YndB with AHSA1/START domain
MSSVIVTTEIAAPVERVFDLFTDVAGNASRVLNIERIEMLTLGGARPGARWLETRRVPGGVGAAEMEITSFDRNRGYTITHHKAGTRIDTRFTFHRTSGGTFVEVEFTLATGGRPPGAVAPVRWAIRDIVREVLSQDLQDLKSCVEGPPLWGSRTDRTTS